MNEHWIETDDGHLFATRVHLADQAEHRLLWLSAMGVPARNYDSLAAQLAGHGIETWAPDWRGLGSSNHRASRHNNWNYATLLNHDLPAVMEKIPDDLPLLVGGHSLGAQFGVLLAARTGRKIAGSTLVATGLPWWRSYQGYRGPALYTLALGFALIGQLCGHYPGRKLGFAGREARGVMRDWSRVVRRGKYNRVLPDADQALAKLSLPLLILEFAQDRLIDPKSTDLLIQRMAELSVHRTRVDASELGTQANHFAWMKRPQAVAQEIAHWAAAMQEDRRGD